MFTKEIDRDIRGVVKIEQDDPDVIKNELEEYVVTKELQKHFRDFFAAYKKGINEQTDKVGVWISGFFGSGKSHFIKILSYLLANEEIDDKKPINYFIEDEKIKDPMVLADINLALSKPTDVISFNIDSRSETSGTKDKDSILNVFLKVFNEKLGYSTNPHVADLERQVDEDGRYEEFKNIYEEIAGEGWVESRHKFNFKKDSVIKSLVQMDYMVEKTAQDWARSTVNSYEISIAGFTQMVKEYLDKKGKDHQIVFLVDEMGQYVGDNSDLMLNLQTITENLGATCRGRAWVVVTSQQDIDSITEVMGRDFSKIQGRFDTRLSLTSANVDEVIKLRILDKKPLAQDTLEILYDNKETIIKNLIIFNDTAEKKLYEDKEDFSQVYPFIPYHFDILSKVLTSVREHSSSGKHLSEGERSMLALFKESAESYMEDQVGRIIPFNIFYDALKKWLDHSHSVVISRALDNGNINPNKEEDNFNVNVLKTLFLIKYIDEIESNVENITTLMVSHVDEDRRELKEKVEEALKILTGEMLVQKNGQLYIFLTNEEQEINRLIENQAIESSQLTGKIGDLIFTDIYLDEKIRAGQIKNRYIFNFNREVDDRPFRVNQANDFGVKIITPNSEFNGNDKNIKMQSSRTYDVYVDLPNDAGFIRELRTAMKIEKFINSASADKLPRYAEIRAIKRKEAEEHNNRARLFLQESLKESKFYLAGDQLDFAVKDFKHSLTEALERLAETVYHKLYYIDSPKEESDIVNLFKSPGYKRVSLDNKEDNLHAIREVLNFIKLKTVNHTTISLREIKNHFLKAPYGFIDVDLDWIISKAFLDGQIALSIHGSNLSLVKDKPEEIIDYIRKKSYQEKLLIEEKEEIPENLKRMVKNLASDLFKYNINVDDPDLIVKDFNDRSENLIYNIKELLKEYDHSSYPGKEILKDGIKLFSRTLNMDNTMAIFRFLRENKDDYLDFRDDYEPIKTFFEGASKDIWKQTLHLIGIFEASKTYVVNEKIEKIFAQMLEIAEMNNPYGHISKLPGLNDDFLTNYNEILDKEMEPVLKAIKEAEERVMEEVDKIKLEEDWALKFKKEFSDLREKAESSNHVAQLKGYVYEADALKIRFLNEINKEVERRAKKVDTVPAGVQDVVKHKTKKQINISIKEINKLTWRIESKEDIDKYLDQLRKELVNKLKDDSIVNIEF